MNKKNMYCKLGQACATNWRNVVLLQIGADFVTNLIGTTQLQTGTAITN